MIKAGLAPPRSPLWTAPGLLLQLLGMFLLPFLVGLGAALFLEVSEVAETSGALFLIAAVLLLPVILAQVLGLALKSWRDLRWWHGQGKLGPSRVLDVLYTHSRVVTPRGWLLLTLGVFLVLVALALKLAEFGLMAVTGLLLFYLVTGWTIFVSTFLIRAFERRMGRRTGGVVRQMMPAVVQAGEAVDEVFSFQGVPVPWGYVLLVEERLPTRLLTETRYALGSSARGGPVEVRGRLRATPRGLYRLGPASLCYQDLLGLTRVSVGAVATAELQVLPPIRPVEVVEPPRTARQAPDVITRPHRFPTEDHFRFREYAPGDDTRRIHWRLSLKSGRLQVRLPESREVQAHEVLLVLDTFMPPGPLLNAAHGAEEILDALVEAWLGIARALLARGDQVTLVAAVGRREGGPVQVEQVRCRPGQSLVWQDLGARACWQDSHDVGDLLATAGEAVHGVVVTGRFSAAPPGVLPGQATTWLFLDPADALGPPDRHWLVDVIGGDRVLDVLSWLFRLPEPAGSDDNALLHRVRSSYEVYSLWMARRVLRLAARRRAGATLAELKARGDAIFRIERLPRCVRLVGLQAATTAARAAS